MAADVKGLVGMPLNAFVLYSNKPALKSLTDFTDSDKIGGPIRYYAEVPKRAESTEAWLKSLMPSGNSESAQDGTPGEPRKH